MKAKIKFNIHRWSGWTKEQPSSESFKFKFTDEETLVVNPKILEQQFQDPFYTIKVSILDSNQVRMAYKGLVLTTKNDGVNLKDQSNGEFILETGQSVKFSTPTMDAGVNVTVTLNEIQ